MKTVFMVCNAHLDPVWLWEKEEGIGEALSTFRIAADFCEREDGFIFNHNEAVLYQWVEEYEPELFLRIKKAVKNGRWIIAGGWFLQPDCNMPSGEGIIRQIKTGQEYFKKHFGENFEFKTALNFDSFGHNRGLVQILSKAGYENYICCRPGMGDLTLPSNDFIWLGYDEKSVLNTHRCTNGYGSQIGEATEKILEQAKKEPDKNALLSLWGIGNHGGGPSKKDYEKIKHMLAGKVPPDINLKDINLGIAGVESSKAVSNETSGFDYVKDRQYVNSGLDDYFAAAKQLGYFKEQFDKSLISWGVGCYTSQILIKQKYRELENVLSSAEKMAVAANAGVANFIYPYENLEKAEKDLLFCQFHDILPGTSIKAAEGASIRMLEHGIEEANNVKTKAFFSMAQSMPYSERGDEIPILVYNPHPYSIDTLVCCEFQKAEQNWKENEYSYPSIYKDGQKISSQAEKEESSINLDWRKRVVFKAQLEPMQMTKFIAKFETLPCRPIEKVFSNADEFVFNNGEMEINISKKTGFVTRCKINGQQMLSGTAFVPTVFEDNEDPWGMTVSSFQKKQGTFSLMAKEDAQFFYGNNASKDSQPGIYRKVNKEDSNLRVIENGDVRCIIEGLFEWGRSVLSMQYILPKNGTEIEIKITVWWNEAAKMLKLCVPFYDEKALYYGQGMFGSEEKHTDGTEVVAQQWTAIANENNCIVCVNKGSYGSSVNGGEMQLNLLRSPAYSAHPIHNRLLTPQDRYNAHSDMGERNFQYIFKLGKTKELMPQADRFAQIYNEPPMALSFYPSGKGEKIKSIISFEEPYIILTSMRKNADSGYEFRLFNPCASKREFNIKSPMYGIEYSVKLDKMSFQTYFLDYKEHSIKEAYIY